MEQQKINIKASDEDLKGRYANNVMVSHTKEEFVLDFMSVLPPGAHLVGRVIVSPGHAKRLHTALSEQITRYENAFGKLEASGNSSDVIGFRNE